MTHFHNVMSHCTLVSQLLLMLVCIVFELMSCYSIYFLIGGLIETPLRVSSMLTELDQDRCIVVVMLVMVVVVVVVMCMIVGSFDRHEMRMIKK